MEGKSTHIITRVLVLGLPLVLVALQLWHPDAGIVGLTRDSNWGFLTYHFFHANWWHLSLNWWCLAGLALSNRYTVKSLTWCFVIASLYPFATDTPIVGLSGFIFAMAGMGTRDRGVIMMMLITIAVTALMPHMAWGLHLWCYLLGLAIAYVDELQGKG